MTLLRWRPLAESMNPVDPYRSFGDLRAEMNRMFGSVFGPGGGGSSTGPAVWAPVVDMYATKDDLIVTTELPGVPDKEVEVSVTGDVLSIRGQRLNADEAKDAHYYWGERWFGPFERHIGLPFPVNAAAVKASFKDGVLTVTLPKADEVRPKQIKIEAF
jgi:HSP20 family protein